MKGKKMKGKKETIMKIDSVEATLMNKPYVVPGFRWGKHMSEKDRPRDKSYKKYNGED